MNNNGKICVSICAETAEEFIENIKRAVESAADIIELRFDCLKRDEINFVLREIYNLNCITPFLATFRPAEQGGKRRLNLCERTKFWQLFFSNYNYQTSFIDFEFDLNMVLNLKTTKSIVSFHDFSGIPRNLEAIYEIYSNLINADIVKIAVQADEITDSLAVWKLLEKAKAEKKQLVPIAMGEAGKWTRILGLAHGVPLTYASLDAGKETAGGQFTVRELSETYRIKELNEQTEIYGIVGNPVSQSISPEMHNAAFKFHNLNAVYIPFEVKNLAEFIKRFIKPQTREIELNFKGFSVTIPHKRAIIEFLDSTDETAQAIGAVNTVKIIDGKLCGYNTDAQGFIEPLLNHYVNLENAKVAVFGNGGAARAAIYALKKEGAKVTILARNLEKAKSLANEFDVELLKFSIANRKSKIENFDVFVNATPLGMKGTLETETPAIAAQMENVRLVYDLVYNPSETQFIKEAQLAGAQAIGGLEMLVAQGAAQFKIWTGKEAPVNEMNDAALRKLHVQK